MKVVKNKVAPPFKQAEFDIIYGSGISWEGTVLDTAIEKKVVQKSGSHFSFGDERLGQGRQNATAFLREHPDVSHQILEQLQALAGPDQVISARLLAATAAEQADGRPPEACRTQSRRRSRGRNRGAGSRRRRSPRRVRWRGSPSDAPAVATRAWRRRDSLERGLRERLLRAGVPLDRGRRGARVLLQAGLVNDGRFAVSRAQALAERGKGTP